MKKIAFLSLTAIFSCLISCKNTDKTDTNLTTDPSSETIQTQDDQKTTEQKQSTDFDITNVPISNAELGDFPYFKLPEGYTFTDPHKYHGTGVTTDYDKEYFYNHGIYTPAEGQTFKAVMRVDENAKDKNFSKLEIQKSFDGLIAQLNGVTINNGEQIKDGEKDRLEKTDPNAYGNGYLHSCNNYDDVHTYIIRKQDYNLWIQYNLGNDVGYITILKTKSFENKMTLLSSSQIQKELNETGKAVLHINFDTDKATLKPDGAQAVAEIVKTLQSDQNLKIAIHGYTDNVGTESHNIELSKDRATTVLSTIAKAGIDKSRLTADGFGSKNPISDNSTDQGKAQNRRVELVKK